MRCCGLGARRWSSSGLTRECHHYQRRFPPAFICPIPDQAVVLTILLHLQPREPRAEPVAACAPSRRRCESVGCGHSTLRYVTDVDREPDSEDAPRRMHLQPAFRIRMSPSSPTARPVASAKTCRTTGRRTSGSVHAMARTSAFRRCQIASSTAHVAV